MSYVLFFVYLFLLSWLLTKIRFVRNTGLSNKIIITLFLIKIATGLIHDWLTVHFYAEYDSMIFHKDGVEEYHLLFSNPKEYLLNIFQNNYNNSYTGFFDITDSFWNNLRSNIISKILSVFDIFSRCNYTINTLFYNFLVFFGSVALYRIYIDIFPAKKRLLIISLFLLPSLIFFTSVIHRDGLIFLGLGIACYNMFHILRNRFTTRRMIYTLLGLMLIFLLRNFVFLTLVPALIAWIIAEKKPRYVWPTFISAYLFFGILFFSLKFVNPALDLPQHVSDRQIAYIKLSKVSSSAININPLFPNFRSFLNNAPQALNHTLMRPYITEDYKLKYIPPALEILFFEILFMLFLLFPVSIKRTDAFIAFGICFGLSMFLEIGYTIPIIGAFVRYRSIYFPFLITPLICNINWLALKKFISIKN